MTAQAALWIASGGAFAVAAVSTVAERKRAKRRDLDSAGWMPWAAIQLLAFTTALVIAALAVRS